MENLSKKSWILILTKGIILIILSLLVFFNPMGTLLGISVFIGIGLLITGVIVAMVAWGSKDELDNWKWKLAEGILDILFGFILISNPQITAIVIPFIIGFWIIFYGIIVIVSAFGDGKLKWSSLILGIIIIWLGNMIMFNPLIFGITVSIWIGLGLLSAGLYVIIHSLEVKKITKIIQTEISN